MVLSKHIPIYHGCHTSDNAVDNDDPTGLWNAYHQSKLESYSDNPKCSQVNRFRALQMDRTIPLLVWFAILAAVVLLLILVSPPERLITPGKFLIIDAARLCPLLPTCFYQNTETPYGRPIIPQTEPLPALDVFFGAMYLTLLDGVVIMGKVPTSVEYWSFIPYLWKQNGPTGFLVFASLSNGFSNFDTAVPNGQIAIIATRNKVVFERERDYLLSTPGFNATIVPLFFPDIITDADLVTILSRASIFSSENALQSYIQAPGLTTYKVTYTDLPVVTIPVSVPGQPTKPGGINLQALPLDPSEITLVPEFDAYTASVLVNYNVVSEIPLRPFLSALLPDNTPYSNGYQCIANQLPCFGDNRQTYYGTGDPFEVAEMEDVLIVAVNHATTGRAFYAQVSLYEETREFGIDSITVFGSDPMFYSHVFDITTPGEYRLAERAYIQQPENIGPAAQSVITARAFVVTPK